MRLRVRVTQHRVPVRTLAGAGAAVVFAALALAAPGVAAAPGLPREGVFVPGRSLAGVSVGMTRAEVREAWGSRLGVCRGCTHATWYFNLRPFEPQGSGVEFRRGRVARVFTLWRPRGWRTDSGLVLGARSDEIVASYPDLHTIACPGYTAHVPTDEPRVVSAFYVFRGRLWAFGLVRRGAPLCL